MGLDGFAMGNLGLNAELTSAQMSNQAEMLAKKELEVKVKSISELAEDNGVKTKDSSDEHDQFEDSYGNSKNKKDKDESPSSLTEEEFENRNPRDFSVRVNQATDMVELYSNIDNKVIESISAKDLMELISKLSEASGILVNRKV